MELTSNRNFEAYDLVNEFIRHKTKVYESQMDTDEHTVVSDEYVNVPVGRMFFILHILYEGVYVYEDGLKMFISDRAIVDISEVNFFNVYGDRWKNVVFDKSKIINEVKL